MLAPMASREKLNREGRNWSLQNLCRRDLWVFFSNKHIFFFLQRVTVACRVGTFLLHLSDGEPSHFLTKPLVRYIVSLHTGYYHLTALGHILFHRVLQNFLKLITAHDPHLPYEMKHGAHAAVPLSRYRLRSVFLSSGLYISLAICAVSP